MIITIFYSLFQKGDHIMLQDLYLLELYFGSAEAAISIEDLVKKHGHAEVLRNLKEGFLQSKAGLCLSGADPQACLCWLSDKGRRAVQNTAAIA